MLLYLEILKNEFSDKWLYLNKKVAYPYEYFKSIDYYQKPVDSLKNEQFFSKLKNACLSDEKIERTREIFKIFNNKNGEELNQIILEKWSYFISWYFCEV